MAQNVSRAFQKMSEGIEIIESVLEGENPKLRLVDGKKDEDDEDVFIGWHYCFVEVQRQVKSAKDVHDALDNKLKAMADPEQVKSFIFSYIESAEKFFQGLTGVVENIKSDSQYYEVIGICGLTRVVWPLVVAASAHGLLDGACELPNGRKLSLLRLIQLVDKLHKVGKFQGQPLVSLAYDLYNDRDSVDKAIKQMVEYHQLWNNRGYTLIERVKPEEDYFDYLLFSYALHCEGDVSVERLRDFRRMRLRAVKVLTKYDDTIVRRHGFGRHKDFNEGINYVGNYILVAGARNIREQQEGDDGVSPARLKDLVSDSGKLVLADTKFQLDQIDGGLPDMGVNRGSIEARTQEIEEFLDESWEILEAECE
ncbi:MAG: hypothetical protein A2002_08315 [Pseudomonadales bacterium GWC1_66_9]|nr:MAG: hypothetical protein A2002_08315 [Pseudomonadales bacterium GWC1_66_9]